MESRSTLDSLESETQILLKHLNARREEVQQGHQLYRLQYMQRELQAAANSIRNVLSDDDPIWIELRTKQQEIERQMEEMAVAAPISAISFAMDSLSRNESEDDLSDDLLDPPEHLPVVQSDLEPQVVPSVYSFSLFRMGKLPFQLALVVVVTLFLTLIVGSLRVSQMQRLGPNGPFISNPTSQ
ncbi:hypothetical protein ACQ4M3_13290 [Leptolyngbya sp. AN03gr2]|uniref:hypothetical protein n=1 Tax=unclassified Leptolyngbya TaxID=2650499 RepID=UPI003D320E95